MAGGKERSATRLAELEWRRDETVVDVGGGNGALLRELIKLRPELRGIVFDLPETVRDEASLGDRIEFVAGSFFESVPGGGAYVLSGILHDWSDDESCDPATDIGISGAPHGQGGERPGGNQHGRERRNQHQARWMIEPHQPA